MGTQTDVLGAHRQHWNWNPACMLLPYQTPSSSLPSVASRTASTSQSGFTTCTSQNGVIWEVQEVSRKSHSNVPPSNANLPPNNKINLDKAIKIYLSDLASRNTWLDKKLSVEMAREALMAANSHAQANGCDVTSSSGTYMLKVFISITLSTDAC